MPDYELHDRPCPVCEYHPTHWSRCAALACEDGLIDEYENDPIVLAPGEVFAACGKCHGTGSDWWCPRCESDLNEQTNSLSNFISSSE